MQNERTKEEQENFIERITGIIHDVVVKDVEDAIVRLNAEIPEKIAFLGHPARDLAVGMTLRQLLHVSYVLILKMREHAPGYQKLDDHLMEAMRLEYKGKEIPTIKIP